MLTCLIPVLFTFYIQGVLKLKNNSGAKGLRVKIVHLVDKSDLFKISNLVYDGREIVRSLYSSLQGRRVLWRV